MRPRIYLSRRRGQIARTFRATLRAIGGLLFVIALLLIAASQEDESGESAVGGVVCAGC